MDNKLKPCPICGKEIEVVYIGGGWFWRHKIEPPHPMCPITHSRKYPTREQAVNEINRRDDGAIIPPCKIGTKVWFIKKDRIPDEDYRMSFHTEWIMGEVHFRLSMIEQFGITVFPTPEEAAQAIAKRRMEDGK